MTRTQGNNADVTSGRVPVEGFTLAFEEVPVLVDAFRRMVRELAYDVCEMAFTTYLCAREHGVPFTALPVFLVRGFHHGAIVRAAGGPVRHPKDLEGRRVGVNRGYTVTTGVWARAVLAREYGVDLDRVTWVPSGDEHVEAYRPPANVAPLGPGRSLKRALLDGDVDAAVGVGADGPDIVPLVPDPDEAGYAALRTGGLYPINHLVVVRDDLLAAHPSLATALTRAFTAAKEAYVRRLADGVVADPTDAMYARVMRETRADPLPYGVAANRPMIDELIENALRQRILTRAPAAESLFAAGS
ncbi:ABC transporter substrate-binding protein [Phytohabitans sp. ZYX-F-186]|uniref:ABC transporter substrate-binding protein n=1 Tax=Phytohabitans maris TaxID=3071409 RepID=A0ABU0ZPD0_9ACTN|nr:ABC transporter substrate-binding protein [Phytohabitans sp. ZYX-F-186]MDQ7908898.1 ABC transporter substrate-binding protein [Phytohabitans sp. ZYX-F-186]